MDEIIQPYENVLNDEGLINSAATDESLLGLLYFPEDQKTEFMYRCFTCWVIVDWKWKTFNRIF